MIPKMIHYCWFGRNKKSDLAIKCIESWKKYCPDYQIIEWNEDNYDVASAPVFVRQALKKKLWAFATDYIRYDVVYRHGGIYLDTDVELVGSLNPFLNDSAFFGFQKKDRFTVNSGLGFGAEQGNPFLLELKKVYESSSLIIDGTVNLQTNSSKEESVFIAHGLIPNGKSHVLDNRVQIYAKEYFAPLNNKTGVMDRTEKTVAIHWYGKSWEQSAQKVKQKKKRIHELKRIAQIPAKITKQALGADWYEKIRLRILNALSKL